MKNPPVPYVEQTLEVKVNGTFVEVPQRTYVDGPVLSPQEWVAALAGNKLVYCSVCNLPARASLYSCIHAPGYASVQTWSDFFKVYPGACGRSFRVDDIPHLCTLSEAHTEHSGIASVGSPKPWQIVGANGIGTTHVAKVEDTIDQATGATLFQRVSTGRGRPKIVFSEEEKEKVVAKFKTQGNTGVVEIAKFYGVSPKIVSDILKEYGCEIKKGKRASGD